MPDESFDEIRTRVLTDNTAQGVLNHLKALESNRAHVRTRWVWELLQNARDASAGTDTGLVASIEQNQSEIVFRHNGADFKIEEITHLIYHGSTKIEDAETIGQYGSGFLTTHLLSSEIHISGKLDDGQSFEFPLRREADSVSELSESMEQAWSAFISSLSEASAIADSTTEFRYPLSHDTLDAAEQGIETLKRCAPFVVAFNQEFSSISIKSSVGAADFKVVARKQLDQDGLLQVTVSESENGSLAERKYLLVQGQKASVAIPFESDDDAKCLSVGDIPRLFKGFPLIGTENFSFPAVINSLNFTPTENRDGVYIAQSDNEANIKNQAVIEEACDLLVELLQFAASANWRNTYLLADVPVLRQRDWLNPDWLRECLKERLVEKSRQNAVVISEAGEAIPPDDLELPFANTDEGVVALWDLLDGWKGAREKLPRRDEAVGWCATAQSWASLSGGDISSLDEVTDGCKLAKCVHEVSQDPNNLTTHRLLRLNNSLKDDISEIDWLDKLHRFLEDNGLSEVIHQYRIVPSQRGLLRTLPNLYRDNAIDPELKNIADLMDKFQEWNIRRELRDTRLTCLAEELGKGTWDNQYVVGKLVNKLREWSEKNPDDNFGQASTRLFTWIVSQKNWGLLQGFPAFADQGESDNWSIIRLERVEGDNDRPLAPVEAWPEDLQPFSDIFPRRHTLANAFFEAVPNPEIWQTLEKEGFLRRDVITTREVFFNTFLPDEPLTEEDHETAEYVTVTDIAFISRDNIGIMARVRDSQSLACIFWRFLTDWLIVHDASGLEVTEAACNCNETHRYYPAEWLVPLKRNRWVPLGGGKRGQVTAQSLADLLRGSGWEPSSLNENPAAEKLLEAIGLTRFDLVRAFGAATDDERKKQDNILTELLDAAAGDINRLGHAHQYIEDLKNDNELPDVLAERRERRRIVNENQRLGSQVEELVKEILKVEGFDVRRTGVGSDFEISYNSNETDDVTTLELTRANQSWLVEVKATRVQDVRMTTTQAETAVDQGDRFLLCVIPVALGNAEVELKDVQANMRFVENIGPRVERLCKGFNDLENRRNNINAEGDFGVYMEVTAGSARVHINSSVWQNDGFQLQDLLNRLLNS